MKYLITSLILVLIFIAYANLSFGSRINDPIIVASNKAAITGKVIDKKTGESLAGVLIEIKGTNIKTYSDLEGNYSITDLDPGSYSFVINFISYSSKKIENINMVAGNEEKLNIEITAN